MSFSVASIELRAPSFRAIISHTKATGFGKCSISPDSPMYVSSRRTSDACSNMAVVLPLSFPDQPGEQSRSLQRNSNRRELNLKLEFDIMRLVLSPFLESAPYRS